MNAKVKFSGGRNNRDGGHAGEADKGRLMTAPNRT